MDNQLGAFLRGIDAAACNWFDTYGGALNSIGFAIAVSDVPLSDIVGVGLVMANAAAQKGCNYDPNKTAPGGPQNYGINGCYKVALGGADIALYKADGTFGTMVRTNTDDVEITGVAYDVTTGQLSFTTITSTGQTSGGSFGWNVPAVGGFLAFVGIDPPNSCLAFKDDSQGDDLTPEDIPVYNYTDSETGCEMNITFKGYGEGPAGDMFQITQIEPASSNGLKAAGGIIGGCNFNPTIVINQIGGGGGGGGGGTDTPITFPTPLPVPGPEDDWWKNFAREALAGVAGAYLQEIISNFLAPVMPSSIYRMVSVCEKNASGEPISEAVEVPIPNLKAPEAQVARLDAIVELLQASKNFKQPICSDKPELLGNWVTVRFESIENSPQGTRPLRKLFRYRSQSALDLGQIAAYWENFTWNAGPVCVQHKNAWWGTPQCWAANADEGKRVIRFAGLEAGIDPDALGEWVISGSVDPRFGMPGTMQVAKVEGLEWITSRQGPSGLPLLTVDP